MAKEVQIRVGPDRMEGVIIFDENPSHLHMQRTAAGFKLSLPVKMGFYSVAEGAPSRC